MRPINTIPDLKHIWLTESWLLAIQESRDRLQLILEVVLTPDHPAYTPPPKDEMYCYRKAVLNFSKVQDIAWLSRSDFVAYDAAGEIDLGHIEVLKEISGGYYIAGDFGALQIKTITPPTLELERL